MKPNRHTLNSTRVEIVASLPRPGQEHITEWIGQQFPIVARLDAEHEGQAGRLQINAAPFEGVVVVNPGEYKFVV